MLAALIFGDFFSLLEVKELLFLFRRAKATASGGVRIERRVGFAGPTGSCDLKLSFPPLGLERGEKTLEIKEDEGEAEAAISGRVKGKISVWGFAGI